MICRSLLFIERWFLFLEGLLLLEGSDLDDVYVCKCHIFFMVLIESLLEGEVHLHQNFHLVPSLLAKLMNECPGGALVHRVDRPTADSHR